MKTKKYPLVTLFLLLFFVTHGTQAAHRNQEDMHQALDAYMAEQMERLKIPGAAVGVVQGNQIVYVQGYGTFDEKRQQPVTAQTPFLLASISKSFTALGIMQLVEAGHLDLDTSVHQILPWFEGNGEGGDGITIRHLLHHTSGFSEVGGYERNLEPNTPDALETSIRGLADETLDRVPDSRFEYSNTNFDVLGLIIETASGQAYGEYVQEHIFAPLEMTHSFTTLETAQANGMASGFYPFFGFNIPYDRWMPYTVAVRPSAGLIASAEDMSHYLIAHLNGGRYKDAQILSQAGMETLHTPGVTIVEDVGYAMGWVAFSFEEAAAEGEPTPTALTHSGTWAGFIGNMVLIPEKQTGSVILMNTGDPLRESAYIGLGWDISLIALGLEPDYFPPNEDFVTQNGRVIAGVVIFLLIIENILLLCNKRGPLFTWLLYLVELGLAGFVLFVSIPGNNTTLPLLYRFAPDIALLYTLILFLAFGVGTARTGYWLLMNRKDKQ